MTKCDQLNNHFKKTKNTTLFMNVTLKKNSIIRRSVALGLQIPRTIKHLSITQSDYKIAPPIIANSFPKSGTHLLNQIFENFPKVTSYGSFITPRPSITFKKLSHQKCLDLVNKIVPGELISAHLFYHPDYCQILESKNAAHYFIFRDIRDVAISEAYYLTYMNKWHRLHSSYMAMDSMEKRINFAITGGLESDFPYDYPNISTRFEEFKGWFQQNNVLCVRFEDLRSNETLIPTLKKIIDFYIDKSEVLTELNIDDLLNKALSSINPSQSHTFREGKISNWKTTLSKNQKNLVKDIAGNLLIELGYEKDLKW